MGQLVDLNAARKARQGHADTGRCRCGDRLRVVCREVCMNEADTETALKVAMERSLAQVIAEMRGGHLGGGHQDRA
jgi:hypothetical protein